MRRFTPGMSLVEVVVWVIECVPWAVLISIAITMSASILFDISLESDSWLGLVARYLPGFGVGMFIMLAITSFLSAVLHDLLRRIGPSRE